MTTSRPCTPPVNSKPSADQLPFWSLKPGWCQPWTIIGTGSAVIGVSCWWPGRLWISIPIILGIAAWWLLFLVIVPAAYRSGDLQP